MVNTSRVRLSRAVLLVVLLAQVIAVLSSLLRNPFSSLYTLVRAAGLFGYVALFWTILLSEYVREARRLFGLPYLRLHHRLAVVAWVLIVLHPLSFSLLLRDVKVLVPVFRPLSEFLTWAGRPALYLFLLATLAGILRASSKRYWKYLHRLNYAAFLLAFVHAWRLGSDLGSMWLRAIWAVMATVVLLVGLHKMLG